MSVREEGCMAGRGGGYTDEYRDADSQSDFIEIDFIVIDIIDY